MKIIRETAFAAVCIVFSLAFLLMSLLVSVKLAKLNDCASELEAQSEGLENENMILRARLENSLSLSELEEYARNVLGMQRCSPGQIIYIDYPDCGLNAEAVE